MYSSVNVLWQYAVYKCEVLVTDLVFYLENIELQPTPNYFLKGNSDIPQNQVTLTNNSR